MQARIEELNSLVSEAHRDSTKNFTIASDTNNQILSLKDKAEGEKASFEAQIKKLQSQLEQKADVQEYGDDNITESKKKDDVGDFANPIEILKIKVKKVTAVNTEKNKLVQ